MTKRKARATTKHKIAQLKRRVTKLEAYHHLLLNRMASEFEAIWAYVREVLPKRRKK